MPTSSFMPKDDSGKADLLYHLFSFHPALRGEKKILQIIGSAYIIDPSTWKPVLSSLLQAGHPTVVWTKGKASAIDSGWTAMMATALCSSSSTPSRTPPTPLPSPGTSVVWKYKAIYRYHDEQVGQWSDVVSVTVGG